MLREAFEKFACGGAIVRMHFEPRINKWANEPGPNRALMIRAIARTQITAVDWFVIRIVRRERTEANGCDQFFFRYLHDRSPMRRIQNRMIERNGKELIWSTRSIAIRAAINIDNIVKITAFGEPKPMVERCSRFLCPFVVAFRRSLFPSFAQPIRQQAKRIVPKRVDLDRLSAAGCHDPVVHFRVHPGELITGFALREQSIVWIDANIKSRAAQMMFGDVDQRGQKKFEGVEIFCAFKVTAERVKKPERRVGRVINAFARAIRKHVWNQTVANVISERAQDVTGFEP